MSVEPENMQVAARTQAERSALSDRAMLDAAIDLVLEFGTDGTTLAMIGEKAGYSRGLATYRFGSKAGLYNALGKAISRNWLEYLTHGVGNKTGIDAMCSALDAIREFVEDSPRESRVLQILYCASASPGSDFAETSVAIHNRQRVDVAEWVRDGQSKGLVRDDVDPCDVASQYVSYISGLSYLWLTSPETFDFSKTNTEMKRQLRASLGMVVDKHTEKRVRRMDNG